MSERPCFVFLCLTLAVPAHGDGRPQAAAGFSDDFSAHAEGSAGGPAWKVHRGTWTVRGGKLVQAGGGEGLAIARDGGIAGSFRLEARFRTRAGISAEGVIFGLRDAARAGPCHLVSMDPEGLFYGSLGASGEFRGDGRSWR